MPLPLLFRARRPLGKQALGKGVLAPRAGREQQGPGRKQAWVARQGVPASPRLVIPHGANITLLNHARTA